MEMPINVMIVLFISIAVGTGIIGFAEYVLQEGKGDLEALGQDEKENLEDQVIPVGNLDTESASSIGRQCVKEIPDAVTKELCFALRVDSNNLGSADGETVEVNGQEYQIKDQTGGSDTVVLLYVNQRNELIFET